MISLMLFIPTLLVAYGGLKALEMTCTRVQAVFEADRVSMAAVCERHTAEEVAQVRATYKDWIERRLRSRDL